MHDSTENGASDKDTQNNSSAIVTTLPDVEPMQTGDENIQNVNIQVGSENFTVILYDNASSQAMLEQMPLTLFMSELNGNEKYYHLPDSLVLFYESFSISYSYTKLGYIEDASGLVDALGSGSIQVTFSVAD